MLQREEATTKFRREDQQHPPNPGDGVLRRRRHFEPSAVHIVYYLQEEGVIVKFDGQVLPGTSYWPPPFEKVWLRFSPALGLLELAGLCR